MLPYEHKRVERKLSADELAAAAKIIEATPPGVYRLRELYGDEWDNIYRPRAYGRWFRGSVLEGTFPPVRWVKKGSDKSHVYEVLPKGVAEALAATQEANTNAV